MNHNGSFKMTTTTFKYILQHYKDLFEKGESRTIPEIANETGLSAETIRNFWQNIYRGPERGKFNKMDILLLLSSEFKNPCQYKEDKELLQKQLYIRKCINERIAAQKNQNEEIETDNKHK